MGDGEAPALFTMDDTGENYVPYTPPEPPAFVDTLPDDLKGNEHLTEDLDGVQLARYYVDSKSNQPVVPDTAEGYEFEAPEGFEVDENIYNAFKQKAFDNGMSQKQFSDIMTLEVERYNSSVEAINKSIEDRHTAAETELKNEWGAEYDAKIEKANAFLAHQDLADENFNKFLQDTRFGDHPQVVRFFAKLADAISESSFVKTGDGKGAEDDIERTEDGRPMLRFTSME